jgi:uncharacterized membrane protein YeiH
MHSFLEYNEGFWSMKMPKDSAPVFLCFVFTVLFDLLQRKNEKQIINKIEIYINILILPVGVFLYFVKHEIAFLTVAIIFSSLVFCLKCCHLFEFIFLPQKKLNQQNKGVNNVN